MRNKTFGIAVIAALALSLHAVTPTYAADASGVAKASTATAKEAAAFEKAEPAFDLNESLRVAAGVAGLVGLVAVSPSLGLVSIFAAAVFVAEPAHAAPTTYNTQSYLDYGSYYQQAQVSNTNWVALPGQPTRTFHKLCISDDSGATIAIGNGISPNITTQLVHKSYSGSSAAEVCYPMGVSYAGAGSCFWIKKYTSGSIGAGVQVINFLY